MKKLVSLFLICSVVIAGCDKKNSNNSTTTRRVALTPSSQAACRDATRNGNSWYDVNNRRINCSGYDNLVNRDNLYSYDNNNCYSTRPNGTTTYQVYVGGSIHCVTSQYFNSIGYTGNLQMNNPYWIGYQPPIYSYYYNNNPSYYGSWGSNYYDYHDHEYSGSDVLLSGLVGVGVGLAIGTLN